ncbi:MAG: triose-phosphate isomerase [Candidatus Woesearchaeota archaeon]
MARRSKSSKENTGKKRNPKSKFRTMIVINFKTYESSTGQEALKLAMACDEVAKETDAEIIISVQAADIFRISQHVSIPVFAQHIDPIEPGSHTGMILPQSIAQAGAEGTLLNHSENRLRIDVLETSIKAAKQAGLKTIVCANDAIVGQAVYSMEPDLVAVEPPELIGGNISVSNAKPEIIKSSVNKICRLGGYHKVLVGAGVKTNADIKRSIELGARGVLLASGITKAKNPGKILRELVMNL